MSFIEMIKNTLILFLLVLYAVSSFRVALPLLEYAVNYKYISTVLCENKEKPKLNCCGKCHVKKQIARAQEQDNTTKPLQNSKDRQIFELFHLYSAVEEEVNVSVHSENMFHFFPAPPLSLGYLSIPSKPPEA